MLTSFNFKMENCYPPHSPSHTKLDSMAFYRAVQRGNKTGSGCMICDFTPEIKCGTRSQDGGILVMGLISM